jgi:microcystin-dependent protein
MDRHVEVEDVADVGNVEAAGGDVGGDQQRELAIAELRRASPCGALVHVAMQRAGVEAVRSASGTASATSTLAVAEDDRVLEVVGARIRSRSTARFSSAWPALHQRCVMVFGGGVAGLGDFDAHRVLQEALAVSFWISGGMVAEKNSVWRRGGSSLQMRSMSG